MALPTPFLDRLLGYQLRRASAAMMADLARELADLDMRPAEVTALLVMADHPDCSQSEVGEALSIKRANMVPLVARLMERGLVDRTRADGRSHALRVSAAGEAVVAAARERIARHEARFLARLSPQQHAALLATLPVIRGAGETAPGD